MRDEGRDKLGEPKLSNHGKEKEERKFLLCFARRCEFSGRARDAGIVPHPGRKTGCVCRVCLTPLRREGATRRRGRRGRQDSRARQDTQAPCCGGKIMERGRCYLRTKKSIPSTRPGVREMQSYIVCVFQSIPGCGTEDLCRKRRAYLQERRTSYVRERQKRTSVLDEFVEPTIKAGGEMRKGSPSSNERRGKRR